MTEKVKQMDVSFLPKDIHTKGYMNSVFQNSECETILRNIVLLQKKKSPDKWIPFSWDDYKSFCTHKVTDSEKNVLNAFAKGGKPVWNTSAYLDAGWLDFDGTNYSFTPKMIEMLGEKYKVV
ncbi:MAG: hypothetical protein KA536_21940 [Saprospiraceae bacterium]|nr:hypothetical protein [Saprospiraceae bacterium]